MICYMLIVNMPLWGTVKPVYNDYLMGYFSAFWSSLNFMATSPTVTKQSANKCRSLWKLIGNSMHVNIGQTNDGIAMKVRYHRKEWVVQS